ncbi:35732_t:CDS:1, partial [Gigaspora margarita]
QQVLYPGFYHEPLFTLDFSSSLSIRRDLERPFLSINIPRDLSAPMNSIF